MRLLVATALPLSLLASAFAQANQTATCVSIWRYAEPGPATDQNHSSAARNPPGRDRPRTSPAPCVSTLCSRRNAPARASGSLVTFEPGARTAWHTHPLGQVLIVTAGTGRVQRWGDPIDEIRQGDVVWIPPGQKHWHGAAPNSSMAHIAIVEQLDGKSVEWMEKVSDAQYGAPLRAQAAGTDAGASPGRLKKRSATLPPSWPS